jgi:Derlin-2/3
VTILVELFTDTLQFLGGILQHGFIFLPALTLAFAYTFSQDNPNANVTMFILSFPAKYLPYSMLAITLVSGGPDGLKVQICGLLSAHAYDFLTRIWPTFGGGTNYIVTPAFVQRWWLKLEGRVQERSYGQAIRPPNSTAVAGAGSSAANHWSGERGPGRRLGE